jgi:RimJ/RimL family protein N-acetyltransferase
MTAAMLDLQPRLRGELLNLRPLETGDREALWAASRDPLIWEQHPNPERATPAGFAVFFDNAMASGGAFAVEDRVSGRIIGTTRFYELDPGTASVAIGYTFLSRDSWGGAANREMKRLLLEHALASVDTVWFHVAATNTRSRRAMEKIGARLSHHGPRPTGGRTIDFCYYRIDRGWQLPGGKE